MRRAYFIVRLDQRDQYSTYKIVSMFLAEFRFMSRSLIFLPVRLLGSLTRLLPSTLLTAKSTWDIEYRDYYVGLLFHFQQWQHAQWTDI